MLDSLVRKLSKLNKQQQTQNQQSELSCSSSSFSSTSSQSSISKQHQQHQQQQTNFVMLELFDLNQSPNQKLPLNQINQTCSCNCSSDLNKCSTIKAKLFDIEHIYEEIEEDNHNNKILLKEECINETVLDKNLHLASDMANTNKKKKCVRFKPNANLPIANEMSQFKTVYMSQKCMPSIQLSSECDNLRFIQNNMCLNCTNCIKQVYLNSILKKPLETDLVFDHNQLIAQPVQLHVHPSYLEISNENLSKSSTASSSSSSSASSSFYTTNSINSTTSSLTSNHSQVFNQLVEDFLNKVTLSTSNPTSTVNTLYNSRKREKLINKSKTINSEMNSSIKNSKSEINLNNSITDNDRLSFRVTNLTIDDLKLRQKQLDSLKKSNKLHEHVNKNKFVPIQI